MGPLFDAEVYLSGFFVCFFFSFVCFFFPLRLDVIFLTE